MQTCKEVQIHGPLCLEHDVLALSIPGCESNASADLIDIVQKFQKKTSCNVLWQGDLLNSLHLSGI
jgi:hypothetical protein